MRSSVQFWLMGALSSFVLGVICLQAGRPEIKTTICKIAGNPQFYTQKVVRIRAQVTSDLMHATVLVNPRCNEIGLALDADDEQKDHNRPIRLTKDENYQQFEQLHAKILQLREQHRQLFGTFEGVFQYRPGRIPNRILILGRISDLYVGEKDDSRFSSQESD